MRFLGILTIMFNIILTIVEYIAHLYILLYNNLLFLFTQMNHISEHTNLTHEPNIISND